MTRNRLSLLPALVGLATGLVSLLAAPSAHAAAPAKVGWWSAAALDEVVVPAPSAPDGGLRIGAAAGEVTAFGAVLFRTDATTALLRLAVASGTGTPAVVACPASADTWTGGGNQPMSTAPGYDCTVARFPGTVSKDGKTLTFALSAFGQVNKDAVDLVVVPDTAAAVPATFSLDLAAPGPRALTITAEPAPPPSPRSAHGAIANPTHSAVAASGRGSPGGVRAAQPASQRSLAVGPADANPAPVVAPSTTTAVAATGAGTSYPPINKAGLAVAVLLLALAGWIRFLPVPKG
jgi:hypothetical protein